MPTADTSSAAPTADTGTNCVQQGTCSAQVVVEARADLVTWLGLEVSLVGVPSATLQCTAPMVVNEVHRKQVRTGAVGLHGLLADTDYTCQLLVGVEELWKADIRTAALPEELPTLTVTVQGKGVQGKGVQGKGVQGKGVQGQSDMASGFLLLNHWRARTPGQRALILDGDGRIRWYAPLEAPSGGIAVTWTGSEVLAGGGKGLSPILMNLDRTVSFEGPPPPDGHFYHHEVLVTDLGILGLTGMDQYPGAPVPRGLRVGVVDPTSGATTYVYETADHLVDWPIDDPADEDPFHVNAALWEDDGTLWLSARGLSALLQIDRSTNALVRRVGIGGDLALVDISGAPLPDEEWFFGQHAPELRGDHLWVFDNGSSRQVGKKKTRVAEFVLDFEAGTATSVWSWTEDDWYEPNFGDVDVLPSGHVLVASGRTSDGLTDPARAFMLELDGDEVVHRLTFDHPYDSLYRAEVIDGCGVFDHAGLCPEI
jgi:hypothetical protein